MTIVNNYPDFLIIGAAKSGTTSLHAYLKQHPEVCMPELKELNYFSPTHPFGTHDLESYKKALTPSLGNKIIGEASPGYLSSPESPELIHNVLGDQVKLIVLLRNPADMMYSHWGHSVRDALETRGAEQALLESFEQEWEPSKWYLHHASRAQFAEQLKRYYALFPSENIKIYIYEEFFMEGLPLFNELCDYLGVSHFTPDASKRHNKGYMPRNKVLHRFINVHYGRYCLPITKRIIPEGFRNSVRTLLDKWNGIGVAKVPPMAPELRVKLEDKLRPGVGELEKMIGRNLSEIWFK